MQIDFSVYEKTRYVIIAMLALHPDNEDEEREAILSALDNNHKIEVNIYLLLTICRITFMIT